MSFEPLNYARMGAQSLGERRWLFEGAADPKLSGPLRLDLAWALGASAAADDGDLAEAVTAERLLSAPGPTAAVLARVLGRIASEPGLGWVATRLSTDADRRGLIVLFARPDRPALSARLRALLPEDHPASGLTEAVGALPPRSSLDLSELSVARALVALLSGRSQPRTPGHGNVDA